MPQPIAAYDDDVAVNEVALQAAGAQTAARSLLRSFLGTAGEQTVEKDADTYSPDEQDEFEPLRDLDGVGYTPAATDNLANLQSRDSAATELLRKQLLGKRSIKHGMITGTWGSESGNNLMPQPQRRHFKKVKRDEESDEDEDGRSRMGRTAMPKGAKLDERSDMASQKASSASQPAIDDAASSKKRGSSYLDQVLAERAARKNKRKKPLED